MTTGEERRSRLEWRHAQLVKALEEVSEAVDTVLESVQKDTLIDNLDSLQEAVDRVNRRAQVVDANEYADPPYSPNR